MNSNDANQSDRRDSTQTQRLDREIRNILAQIENEPVPKNLTKLAQQLQAALQRRRETMNGD
ncbi:hypothetical protein [Allomesorhizobium alhagi]|jgi:uncharacterized protein (UPF0147 family)|uniref:Anti-sigma factor NepR domain-containing protein n=1 Tax=Mesorhizobium alhagi CCNWXJ12-2 TaxID=1107882 RepID=H0HKG0_9HYPH|nr:hypothetical protein [Mesorhizobium alhagi]EHK58658.1 hypothetical protein MAXJ12_03078 [Mesorhizobium alhagi CCNWXJ12-2]